MTFEVGKLYRHRMVRMMPDEPIKACIVKRSCTNPTGWVGGINTIQNIKDCAGGMMLVEYYDIAIHLLPGHIPAGAVGDPHNPWAIFLAGDRFVMLDVEFVEPVIN